MPALNILITGASGGIGAATALHFASPTYPQTSGHTIHGLALHYSSNKAKAEAVKSQIHSLNASLNVQLFHADLSQSENVSHLHSDVVSAFSSPINVLFANAGTSSGTSIGPQGSIGDVSLEVFEKTWRVNTLSIYQLTQLCIPEMAKQNFGRIIYNSSIAAMTGGVVGPHYASSKSALHGMLHFLAQRYAKDGVTVNAVAPALIEDTTMLPEGSSEMRAKIPVGRLGKPEEIASVVGLMVANGYVSNKVWGVDGGWYPY